MSPWSENTNPSNSFIRTLTVDFSMFFSILSGLPFTLTGVVIVTLLAGGCDFPFNSIIEGTERIVDIAAVGLRCYLEMRTVQKRVREGCTIITSWLVIIASSLFHTVASTVFALNFEYALVYHSFLFIFYIYLFESYI